MKKGFRVRYFFVPSLGRGYYKQAIIIAETEEEALQKANKFKLRRAKIYDQMEVYD